MEKITTFKEYQDNSIGMRLSLKRFLEKHPNLPNDVIELLGVAYDGLGLGEAGEVQGKIKKIIRDDGGIITDEHREAIKSEIGDTLWYLTSMCQNLGFTLEDAANSNIKKINDRRARKTLHGSGDNR